MFNLLTYNLIFFYLLSRLVSPFKNVLQKYVKVLFEIEKVVNNL